MRFLLALVAACLAWLQAIPASAQSEFRQGQFIERAAEPRQLSLTFGVEQTSGDYGTGVSTEVYYFPVTLWQWSGPNMYQLTVPYIRVTGPTNGVPVDVGRMGRPIYGGMGGGTSTESGLGDIEAGYRRVLFDDLSSGTRLDAVATVKFGTADETRLLGTGENDYWAELDAYKTVGRLTWLAALGYRVYGDPPGVDLRDVWFGSAGVAVRHADGAGVFGVLCNFGQAITASGDPQRELKFYVRRQMSGDWGVLGYLLAGSGNSSPDTGFGLLLTRRY